MTEVLELFRSYTMSQRDRTGKIVGHFSCPHQLGNRLFDFLNAFLIAVVTDRAPSGGPAARWRTGFARGIGRTRAPVSSTCARGHRPAGDGADLSPDYPPRLTRPAFRGPPGYWAHHPAPDQLACCGIDRLSTPMLMAGVLERNDAAALAWPGATLGAAAAQPRRRALARGEAVAYGAAFDAAFASRPLRPRRSRPPPHRRPPPPLQRARRRPLRRRGRRLRR